MKRFLNYVRTGGSSHESGDRRPLLMFHGYGQNASIFKDIEGYSFDLFFHGKSEWSKGEEPLEKSDWKELMTEFLHDNNIERFSVLGFSMGGKFALATLEAFPDRIDKVILLAPDGIKTSFWYSLATYPIAFRKFFKGMISNHQRFLRIATMSKKLGLIDKGVLRFVQTQMDSEEKRKRVYYSWVVFRHLRFDIKKLSALITRHNIDAKIFIGRHDKIIKAKHMKKLTSRVEILDAGHNDLIKEFLKTNGNRNT